VDGQPQFLHESAVLCDHSKTLAPFIAQIFGEANITAHDLDAVAVSKGPGSYTGLRIGVATAKGLCYAAGKPLIAIGTLDTLAQMTLPHIANTDISRICTMIDARRMEVYAAFFDNNANPLTDVTPVIVDEYSFKQELEAHRTIFVGSGATKCEDIIIHPNAAFMPLGTSAVGLAHLAQQHFERQQFECLTNFEPFYLKSFAATQAKKGMVRM
jgi:tRNA threonylcarbamoyladenosine biosynthesis protein TsaB